MKFNKFCQYLSRLEETSSRNSMTELLVGLLDELSAKEIRQAVYLALGMLQPRHDSLEFNIAEKQLQKGLALAFDVDLERVERLYRQLGDLGIVAQKLASPQKGKPQELVQVYDHLVAVAQDDGEGSQDRKVKALAKIFGQLDALSARYVARIIIGKLRLGFSDKTVLDAISVRETGSKDASKDLERVYQLRPDIGLLAAQVKAAGLESIDKIEISLGTPLMSMLCQRLKSPVEMIKKMGQVAVEPKFDGTRVQIHYHRAGKEWRVKTFTRNLEENSHMFPELDSIGKHLKVKSVILDCEAVGYNPKTNEILPFQETITRKRKHGIEEAAKSVPLRFYLFDIMYLDGHSLVELPYRERREKLKQIHKNHGLFMLDDYHITESAEEITRLHQEMLNRGLEGAIIKKIDSRYVPGRTGWRWVKMKEVESSRAKLSDTIDAVVMGYYSGKGKRTQFGLGAFLVGVRRGDKYVSIAKIGTGLSDSQFRELKQRLDRLVTTKVPKEYLIPTGLVPPVVVVPELVVEVAADEITKSPVHTAGLALRFPRLIRFRDDKSPQQATTLDEVRGL